jgi:molybdenum cofactor cytidylyltransferase
VKFGRIPAATGAIGAILAHAQTTGDKTFKKGRVLSAEDIAALQEAGVTEVVAARLEEGDIGEDTAAERIAAAAAGANVTLAAAFTGRANLYADVHGVAVIDRAVLEQVNGIDESITIATVPPFEAVQAKQFVATVKIIPFAVDSRVVECCAEAAAEAGGLVRIAAFARHAVGLVQTALPATRDKVLDKTTEVMRHRIEGLKGRLVTEIRCAHDEAEVADAIRALRGEGCDTVLIVGASAITDRRDIIPAAIETAGGRIEHLGMPVDPGNLMLLARGGDGVPVVGLPGCARSRKFNGVDWVLQRLLADVPLSGPDIMAMGAGGLLKEMPSRPQPRAGAASAEAPRLPRVAALVLAAGQSRRMGSINKLLAEIDGKAMLWRVADAVLASKASSAVAVLGHEAAKVRAALGERNIATVENADYADGLSTSLRRGLAALPDDIDGVLVCLGDMPRVTAGHIDKLIAAFNPLEGRAICVPTYQGKRGNPVLWGRRFFPEMADVAGDVGARHLIGEHGDLVGEVEMGTEGVLIDIDTPEALKRAGG